MTPNPFTAEIHDERPESVYAFAVTLTPCIPFPGDPMDGVTKYQIGAATDREEGGWSWVSDLLSDEREAIGYAMMDRGCSENRWYWCILSKSKSNLTN